MRGSPSGPHALAIGLYLLVAVGFSWPLPAHLSTALPGPITGDTGVYAWNLWLFRHELLQGRNPLSTWAILALSSPVDLSLHNYTVFANLLALPLLPELGLVATYNVVRIGMRVLTAYAMFLLARHLTKRWPESWLAGALFAWSPILVTRAAGHFSLVLAAPLPIFVLACLKLIETRRSLWAAAVGAAAAWAALCDAYYAVYCLLLGACLFGGRIVTLDARPRWSAPSGLTRSVTVSIGIAAAAVAAIALTGGTRVSILGMEVSVRSLYTPVLVATLLFVLRVALAVAPRVSLTWPFERSGERSWLEAARLGGIAAVAGCLPVSPILVALGRRLAQQEPFRERIFWRSSPDGVDLASFLLPNPNHPLFGSVWREWLATKADGYIENVSSLTYVALVVVVLAIVRHGFRPERTWVWTTGFFGALALGPFVTVAGFNTYVPGPWALLRFVPLIGNARTPARFSVVLMLGVAILFALALAHMARTKPHRLPVVPLVAACLLFELVPAPRTIHAVEVPAIYSIIAADPRDVRVLELPVGIRDGRSSLGDFNAETQFYQTFHGKAVIGGYLSRVPRYKIARHRRWVTLRTLMMLSEGRRIPIPRIPVARARAARFAERVNLGYVVIDRRRASEALRTFAIEAFRLEKIAESGTRELYRPQSSGILAADADPQ